MIFAYRTLGTRLERLPFDAPLTEAVWVDLYRPQPEQVAQVAALGIAVPSLEDMEEIEISNRLYREDGVDYMTVVLPGQTLEKEQISAPVCLILAPHVLVTVRYHAPRPFETFPDRAGRSMAGCGAVEPVFLGLLEDITGRLADILEGAGKALDKVSQSVFRRDDGPIKADALAGALQQVGREGDVLGRVRLALLTLDRAVGFYAQTQGKGAAGAAHVQSLARDIQALEVHGDFLAGRVALASDATLGMINLAQNSTVRIVSVVAVLFLPPTLIASIYGMNFKAMPELVEPWGYPVALGLMLASAVGTYLFFRWKNWL
jgi:magnesium transporter